MEIRKIQGKVRYLLGITFGVAFFDILTTINFIQYDNIYEANPFILGILLNHGIVGFIAVKTIPVLLILFVVSRLIDYNKQLIEIKKLNYLNMCYGICFSIIIGNIFIGIRNIVVGSGMSFFSKSDPLFPLAMVVILPIVTGLLLDVYVYQIQSFHRSNEHIIL